jgi:tetratricopeptide (TPR) repeat protein
MIHRIIVSLFILLFLASCFQKDPDARLARISALTETSPDEAFDSLRVISYDSLSDADKYLYDFLSVKVSDKAYITHTSDSLILKVINYEAKHPKNGRYAEALYYGGRVYSDLGDYPTAINYFQEALDLIPDDDTDTQSIRLKGNVLSQLARRLNSLRLYSQAVPYLTEAIQIDSILCDTFNIAYDHQLIGAIYFHQDSLAIAANHFAIAKNWAQNLSERDVAHMQMYQAAIAMRQNDVDSALTLIRGIPEKVRPMQRNIALAYSSDIYLAAGKYDSAYIFADGIVHSSYNDNIKSGYGKLFSSELRNRIPKDSIVEYVNNFYSSVEDDYNMLESQQIVNQISSYNYALQQRERQKAEVTKNHYIKLSMALGLLVLIVIFIAFFVQYKRKSLLLELNSTILELETIQNSLTKPREATHQAGSCLIDPYNVNDLRERLKAQLKNITEAKQAKFSVSPIILDSDVYKQIQLYLADGKTIPEKSPIWESLEAVVVESSPSFKRNLQLLVGNSLKPQDFRTVLLIKCGISPGDLTVLLGRTKGTISYRRKHICEIILGERIDAVLINQLIYCI